MAVLAVMAVETVMAAEAVGTTEAAHTVKAGKASEARNTVKAVKAVDASRLQASRIFLSRCLPGVDFSRSEIGNLQLFQFFFEIAHF
ncbi:hypothetical protein [Paenibacillus sp. H1-7]|uniref:hypothetical protein n=1 Tax=Paenibacillus sp. H1-7 TaxID=2282849 RepID=UPI001EF8A218|nr:hypothetical protein [Paenibacillus sp. H1-7]